MARAVLLTGGNLGDVEQSLVGARERIAEKVGRVEAASGVHTSEPWGFEAGELFRNQALIVETPLQPEELLDALEQIEREMGRGQKIGAWQDDTRGYGSRTMDIDIIFYDDMVISTPRLAVPHPRMALRRFVLEPLREIAPDYIDPLSGHSVEELLERL